MNPLRFHGDLAKGDLDMNKAEMVCIPEHKYKSVDLCLKSGNDGKSGWNLQIAAIQGDWLAYEEKVKLGNEITKRWNESLNIVKVNMKIGVKK